MEATKQKVNYEQAVTMYANGLTCKEIGEIFGADASTVHIGLRRRKVTMRGAHQIPKLDKHKAVKLYSQGKNCREIAEMFGVTQSTVNEQLHKLGVEMRKRGVAGEGCHLYRGGTRRDKVVAYKTTRAIDSGELTRPEQCESCNSATTFKDGRAKIEAHHDDYNYPLAVRWLCRKCHHQWHKTNKAIPAHG